MILKFSLSTALFIGVFFSIFNIYKDALCNDRASLSFIRLGLRETLTKKNQLTKINNLIDKTSLVCGYILIQKESTFTLNRFGKAKKDLNLGLGTSITNE